MVQKDSFPWGENTSTATEALNPEQTNHRAASEDIFLRDTARIARVLPSLRAMRRGRRLLRLLSLFRGLSKATAFLCPQRTAEARFK